MRPFAIVALAAFSGFFCATAQGQQFFCTATDPSEELLRDHGEQLTAQAITNHGHLMSIYVSESGSFSIVLVPPDKPLFCAGGSGEKFHFVGRTKKKSGGAD